MELASRLTDSYFKLNEGPEGGYWGARGAGAIFFAKDTGRFLLGLRSGYVNEPGTWGGFGGKLDEGEDAEEAVRREIKEETGYDGNMKLVLLYVYKDRKFRYFNYIAVVDNQFNPVLNWENDMFEWVEFGNWPSPLHYGTEAFIENSLDKLQQISQANQRDREKSNGDDTEEMTTEAAFDLPPAHIQQVTKPQEPKGIYKASSFNERYIDKSNSNSENLEFIKFFKPIENQKSKWGEEHGGYIAKTDSWKPILDPSKGVVIGYGHAIPDLVAKYGTNALLNGSVYVISDADATKFLSKDIEKAEKIVRDDIKWFISHKKVSEKGAVLDNKKLAILSILAFKGSIRDFPKLTDALLHDNWELAKKEATVTYIDRKTGERKPLKGRNEKIVGLIDLLGRGK